MKKSMMSITLVFLFLALFPHTGRSIDIDIGDLGVGLGITPPPFDIKGEPELLPIPGRYAYFVPDIDVDIFFYHGRWYRPYRGRWFGSTGYNGPWERIHDVPSALVNLPSDYRNTSPDYYPVPYSELRDNWQRWERDKYWDRRSAEEKDRRGMDISQLPPVGISGPPEVFPIPGRYVYFVPDTDADVFFYHGRWYRFYKGRWFRSARYDGRWYHARRVPPAVRDVPLDYRIVPPGFYRIPYRELTDNWERWERGKAWERRNEGRDRYGEEGDKY